MQKNEAVIQSAEYIKTNQKVTGFLGVCQSNQIFIWDTKPTRPVLRQPLKSWSRWGAVWIFLYVWKISVFRRRAKRAGTANYFSANQTVSH